MESKNTFFILIVIVAVMALAIAALAGYLFLAQGNSHSNQAAAVNQAKGIPKEEDMTTVSLFDGKRYFNLKNDDPKKIAIIQVNVSLKCLAKFKDNKKEVKSEEKITSYSPEIQELVVKFFLNMTEDQIKSPDQLDEAKTVLKKQINDLLKASMTDKQDIVYEVIFSEWLFQ